MFGVRLRRLRKQRNLTQVEVAKAVGIAQSYLSDLERGIETNPSREVIQALAKVLGVRAKELAGAVWEEPELPLEELQLAEVSNTLLQELTNIWPDLTPDDRETAVAVTRSLWERRKQRDKAPSDGI